MADTERTKSAILTLLADNTSGAISPQDVRDTVVSLIPGYGGMYISSAAATTIAGASTWTKGAGTTTSTGLSNFTMPADNRLTYTGTPDVHCHIAMSFSVTSAGNNKTYEFGVALNGTINTASIVSRKIATGADVGSSACHTDITLSTNDYIEMWVQNTSDGTNMTYEYGYLFALAMLT